MIGRNEEKHNKKKQSTKCSPQGGEERGDWKGNRGIGLDWIVESKSDGRVVDDLWHTDECPTSRLQ